ncbi:MAG: trimethylamine methyltransferase family protein [Anaerolineales bacterium]|nr:trimethylamine methyltransferase family protein [Anaerolineales bacterium]
MSRSDRSSRNNLSYNRLDSSKCEQIHVASLQIMERTGIDVHHPEAREILERAGASVQGERVRVPEHLVEWALSTAPRRLTLYDRAGNPAVHAWGEHTFFGGGSDCLYVLDHHSGKRRLAVLDDVRQAVRLMDGLDQIDFVMSAFLPSDVDQRIYECLQMEVMLNNTSKPIVFVTPEFEGVKAVVEMCEAVAGGAEAFRQRPFATCYINVTSGLVANQEALQKCIYLADKGLPLLYIPLNAAGVNSPATTAGCLAAMNAGSLLGILLAQLVREGTPVAVPGWNGGPYNLQTMVANYVLADGEGVAASMGKYYQLPVFGLGGATDSKLLDQQCAAEAALCLFSAHLNGANIIHDCGFMDAGMQGSLQLLAITNDLIGFIRAATRPVEISEETLALDLIDELGPSGNYLASDHTYRHFREPFYSSLADKRQYANWVEQGGTTMEERAADQVDEILRSHHPQPLPESVRDELAQIVSRERERVDQEDSVR